MDTRSYALKLNSKEAQLVFNKLARCYRIVAPITQEGKGRFSETSIVTYDEAHSFDEIEFSKPTFFSAKHEVFPIRETLFDMNHGVVKERNLNMKPTIVFLRSCDIHAMQVIDTHFLKDSEKQDYYYKRRREKIKFFLMECPESFENCYCVSLGTNKANDYAVFLRRAKDGYEALIKDGQLKEFFPQRTDSIEYPRFVKQNPRVVAVPEYIPVSIFENDVWKEYSQRCIACGRCNTSCPTCTCFTIQDVSSEDALAYARRRIWSSCHVDKFSLLAGGYDFRVNYGERMRYKVLHKIRDFNLKNGRQMCVGCGRCDDVCPEYISMFRSIDKICNILKYSQENG